MYEVGAWVTVTAMKKLLVLIAALALFAVGCKSDTTIDATGVGADADAAAAVPDEEPTSAPTESDPGAAEAIRAVAQADNWCEAAAVVDEGAEGTRHAVLWRPGGARAGAHPSARSHDSRLHGWFRTRSRMISIRPSRGSAHWSQPSTM